MWRNILPHVHGWTIIMDEKRWMNQINGWIKSKGWKIKMNEHNLFATKSYVLM